MRGSAPATQAIVMPPPGGPSIVGVTQRGYSNAIEQDIALSTDSGVPGQNRIQVQMFGPRDSRNQTALPDRPLGAANISGELRRLFPGVRMQRSSFYVQNSYGPFGYAVGRYGDSDLCFYGWQRITQSSNPFAARGTIQIRVRLCQRGATEQSLLATMYGYTVTASSDNEQWNPFGNAPPPDPRLGAIGQAIYPSPTGQLATVFPEPPAAPAPAPQPRPRRAALPASAGPAPDVIAPGAPIVPPPPGVNQTVIVPPPPQ